MQIKNKATLITSITLALLLFFGTGAISTEIKSAPISLPSAPKAATVKVDTNKFTIYKSGTIVPNAAYQRIAVTQLPNGKIVAAWEKVTADRKFVGEAQIFSSKMEPGISVYYTNPANQRLIKDNAIIALGNNTALIAYADNLDKKGKYVVINESGKVVKGPVIFNDAGTDTMSLSYLPGRKTVLLCYNKLYGSTGRGEYQIINEAGNVVWGPVTFNNKGLTSAIGATATNGLLFFNYTCGFARNKLCDFFGNVVRDEVQFGVKPIGPNQPILMENDNILLLYTNHDGRGMVSSFNPQGEVVANPAQFTADNLSGLSATKLKSSNIFVLYTRYEGILQKALFTLLDKNGARIKEFKMLSDELDIRNDMISHVVLQNGKGLIIYGGTIRSPQGGPLTTQLTAYTIVNIE